MSLARCTSVILAALITTLGAVAQGPSLPTLYLPQPFDLQHYEVAIVISDPASKVMAGQCEIMVRWTTDQADAVFPFHLRSLTIDSVRLRGKPLTVADVNDPTSASYHHTVSVGSRAAGQTDTIRIHYHGTMTEELGGGSWGGVQYQDSVLYAMGVGFNNNYVSATQHWMPCYDHPSDKATLTATFFIPEKMTVASNGLVTQDVVLPASPAPVRLTRWTETHETATYLMTFVIAPYRKLSFGTTPVPMDVYALARDTAVTRRSFKHLPTMVSVLQSLFTPYPFAKVGYANTSKGSMEHQTMICFALSVAKSGDTVNTTAAHELAHQWFGDLVSPLDFRHAWLTESFATFTESLWRERLFSASAYHASQYAKSRDYITRIARTTGIGQREGVFPIYDFPRASVSNYPETIYQKGAVVIGMARALMGDSAFFRGLRQYLNTHAYSTATTQDLIDAMQAQTSVNMQQFFTEWIYGKGWAKLRMEVLPGASATRVRLRQVQHSIDTSWTSYTDLPFNCVYTGVDDVVHDTLFVLHDTAAIEFDVRTMASLKLNDGTICRSLADVVQTTAVTDDIAGSVPVFTVAPSPAVTSCTLTRGDATERASVDIVDVTGRSCLHATWDVGAPTLVLSTETCTTGSYWIVLRTSKGLTTLPLAITPSVTPSW